VYIKNTHLFSSGKDVILKINFLLEDQELSWSTNDSLIDGVSLRIDVRGGKKTASESISLAALINKNPRKRYDGTFTITLEKESPLNISLEAYCSDEYLVGEQTVEQLFSNDKPVIHSGMFGKVFDHRLFEEKAPVDTIAQSSSELVKSAASKPYISYTTDKRAHVGIIVDIEPYLLKSSRNYNLLTTYKKFYEYVKSKSDISTSKTKIYIRDRKNKEFEYTDCGSQIISTKLSETKFLVSTTINLNNIGISEANSIYDIKFDIAVNDASESFIDSFAINALSNAKDVFGLHKLHYENVFNDKNIIDQSEFYYKNFYDQNVQYYSSDKTPVETLPLYKAIQKHCYSIAELSAIFYKNPYAVGPDEILNYYASFYMNLADPLVNDPSGTSFILEKLETLRSMCLNFSKNYSRVDFNQDIIYKNDQIYIEKEYNNCLDLTHDRYYGFDVLFNETVANSSQTFQTLSQDEYSDIRKKEANKYFKNLSKINVDGIKNFSISYVDLGIDGNQILRFDIQTASTTAKLEPSEQIYIKIEEYNNTNTRLPINESIIDQFNLEGLSVESVANRNNGSVDQNAASTLFDTNQDTIENSKVYIESIGLQKLYMLLDNNMYMPTDNTNTLQGNAELDTVNSAFSTANLTDAQKLAAKAKLIMLYNTIFEVKQIEGNFMELNEKYCSSIFTKKLKQLNQYFILKQKTAISPTVNSITTHPTFNINNVNSKFFNRYVSKPRQLVSAAYE
jgi:hypothetical protein